MEPGHVGRAVANHQVGGVALKVCDDGRCGGLAGDVALQLSHALNRCHWLQVDCHDLRGRRVSSPYRR
eukprot:364741-Chlamydomonas_euryale.AAC.21